MRAAESGPVTGRFCAPDESARNAGGTPGCGTAHGAARRTRGTQTGSPPVPAGRGCRRPSCGAPVEREASAALAAPVRTPNAGTRVRTHRTGSLAPRPAPCRAAAARAAGCSMRSYVHGRARFPRSACRGGYTRHTPPGVRAGRLGLSRPRACLGHLASPGFRTSWCPAQTRPRCPVPPARCRCSGLSSSHGDRTI